MTTSASSSKFTKDSKIKRGSQTLPKTGEEDSSVALALKAWATATGLAFLPNVRKMTKSEDC